MKRLITILLSVCCLASSVSFALPVAPQNLLSDTKQVEQVVNSPLYNYVNSTGGETSLLIMIYTKIGLMSHYLIHSAVVLDHLEDIQRRSLALQEKQLSATLLTNQLLEQLSKSNMEAVA